MKKIAVTLKRPPDDKSKVVEPVLIAVLAAVFFVIVMCGSYSAGFNDGDRNAESYKAMVSDRDEMIGSYRDAVGVAHWTVCTEDWDARPVKVTCGPRPGISRINDVRGK